MATALKIDFVSDVSCPWCAIGLKSLQQAIARIGDTVEVELHFQPFELNPQMPPGGQDTTEHLIEKYGGTPEQFDANRAAIRERGAALGFDFRMDKRGRIYNTFDAHRLLHWAESEGPGKQLALKEGLLTLYFTDGGDPSDHDSLVRVAGEAGLDMERARQVLATGEFADVVRAQERFYTGQGIQAVPSVIINNQHLLQGGQPPEVFERALRQIAGV
jgi:predicted DsbA family dithiol-disulfide isomerase